MESLGFSFRARPFSHSLRCAVRKRPSDRNTLPASMYALFAFDKVIPSDIRPTRIVALPPPPMIALAACASFQEEMSSCAAAQFRFPSRHVSRRWTDGTQREGRGKMDATCSWDGVKAADGQAPALLFLFCGRPASLSFSPPAPSQAHYRKYISLRRHDGTASIILASNCLPLDWSSGAAGSNMPGD